MKKILAALLSAAVLGTTASAASVPSDWARDEIGTVYPDMFSSMQVDVDYQRPITRAEFCMIAFRVFSELNGGLPDIKADQPFSDVGADTIDMYIPLVYALGIVRGVSATEFNPRGQLTRQELCTIFGRLVTIVEPEAENYINSMSGAADKFADSADIADWARNYVNCGVKLGIIKGTSDTELSPLGTVSMEQAIAIANRITSLAAKFRK